MDWYPLLNSLRIAAIGSVLVFFSGIFAAYYVARLPRAVKGLLDVVLTLPLVLPPTVVGYFLLLVFGAKRPLGIFLANFGIKLFSAAGVRRKAPAGHLPRQFRHQVCDDLVRRHPHRLGGGLPAHVSHRPGRL